MEEFKKNLVVETILKRRSIRSFEDKQVPREKLQIILRCGIYAPTAWHRESWAIRVIQNKTLLDDFNRECLEWIKQAQPSAAGLFSQPDGSVFYHAPTLVVIAGDKDNPFSTIDCSLVAQNVMLAACALGVGSCVIGFVSKFLKGNGGSRWNSDFQIPTSHESVVAVALGCAPQVGFEDTSRDASKIVFVE